MLPSKGALNDSDDAADSQRVLAASVLTSTQAHTLAAEVAALNSATLARQIDQGLDTLWALADDARGSEGRRAR